MFTFLLGNRITGSPESFLVTQILEQLLTPNVEAALKGTMALNAIGWIMLYLRNLRDHLQERRDRVYRCGRTTYQTELSYFLDYLDDDPYVKGLLTALDAEVSQDFETWAERPFGPSGSVRFPNTEAGRAKMCIGLLKQCAAEQHGNDLFFWGRKFGGDVDFDLACRAFTENVVDPLINYLRDRVEEARNVLFAIQRFKLKTEWFTNADLFIRYTQDTSRGEAHLEQALRAGLFEGGIDYPFSQPASPSGKADVVALLGSDDPMVLEVKVFDPGKSRGVRHLQQGFHQVLRYANDYNENSGYLAIFNCSENQMVVVDGDSEFTEYPIRIIHSNTTVFVFVINVHPDMASASRENPSNRVVIDRRDLVVTPGDQ